MYDCLYAYRQQDILRSVLLYRSHMLQVLVCKNPCCSFPRFQSSPKSSPLTVTIEGEDVDNQKEISQNAADDASPLNCSPECPQDEREDYDYQYYGGQDEELLKLQEFYNERRRQRLQGGGGGNHGQNNNGRGNSNRNNNRNNNNNRSNDKNNNRNRNSGNRNSNENGDNYSQNNRNNNRSNNNKNQNNRNNHNRNNNRNNNQSNRNNHNRNNNRNNNRPRPTTPAPPPPPPPPPPRRPSSNRDRDRPYSATGGSGGASASPSSSAAVAATHPDKVPVPSDYSDYDVPSLTGDYEYDGGSAAQLRGGFGASSSSSFDYDPADVPSTEECPGANLVRQDRPKSWRKGKKWYPVITLLSLVWGS